MIYLFTALGSLSLFLYLLISRRKKRIAADFIRNWGKRRAKNWSTQHTTYFKLQPETPGPRQYRIDDATWSDLDFDTIFAAIDRCVTPVGSHYLYNLLRHPLLDTDSLARREVLIAALSADEVLRTRVQVTLSGLAHDDAGYLANLIWHEPPGLGRFSPILQYWRTIPFVLLIILLITKASLIPVLPCVIVNFFIHYYYKNRIETELLSLGYLGRLITAAQRLSENNKLMELLPFHQSLREALKGVQVIARKIFLSRQNDPFGFYEYIKIIFLIDITTYLSTFEMIRKNRSALKTIFESIGFLDTMIAVASFRQDCDYWCHPRFTDTCNEYAIRDCFNPLVENSVSNTFSFESNAVLITGSNMAGKTTFLKTIGVNAVLSQTINTSMARSHETPFLRLMSSIGRSDNLVAGKSYYLAEVESVLRLINESRDQTIVHLFILDEIFRGTNSTERLAISVEVLQFLANKRDFVMVATHDLALCSLTDGAYCNFHFKETICETGLSFDFKLRPGISPTRNAIALLRHVGYPDTIISAARDRVETLHATSLLIGIHQLT